MVLMRKISFSMKNIIATINRLEQQLAQLNPEEFSTIERDILLEKMRSLYEKVLMADLVVPEEETDDLDAPAVVAPIVGVLAEEPVEESVIELIEDIIDEVEQLPEEEDDEVAEEVEEAIAEESAEEVEEEAEEEMATEPVNESVGADEESSEEQADETVEEQESESTEEVVVPKGRIDHKKVLSLYDDEEEESAETCEEEPSEEPQEVVEELEMETPVIDFVIEEEVEEEVVVQEEREPIAEKNFAPDVETANTVVLADVLGGEQTTIADTMATTQISDVATVASAAAMSLMKSVSINDRVLLTRDLFAGNGALYEQAMEVLDSYESLDEAMLFIYDNFDWNPNSEGAKLLVDLLMRKLL